MKKLSITLVALLMMVSLTACFGGDDEEEKKDDVTTDKDVVKDDQDDGSLDDMMSYFKAEGIEYRDDEKLSNFDWAAKEGNAFTYNDANVYMYKVDPSDTQVSDMLTQAKKNNLVTATQNGVESQYGARVNGNYLMLYDQDADVDTLTKIFDKYEYQNKDNAK